MNAETIRNKYQIIYPQLNHPLTPDMHYRAVITHAHTTRDVTARLATFVHAAEAAEIDELWTSGHDTTKEYGLVSNVISKYNYHLVARPAIEVSARGPHNQVRHVMVYGVEDVPRPGLTPPEVNEWAHAHGPHVRTAVAHPELHPVSVRREEHAEHKERPREQQFDLGEMVNGEVMSINAWRERHPVLRRLVDWKLPPVNVHDTMSEVVLVHFNLPVLGGDDFHHPPAVGNVINLVPGEMDVFEAASSGQLLIAVKREPIAPATWRFGVVGVRGALKDRQIKHQWPKAA